MQSRSSRYNLMAGGFLLISLVLGVVVVIVLSDMLDRFERTSEYMVGFDLSDGTMGLSVGSSVNLGGQRVGRVTGIVFREAASGDMEGVDVRISVRQDLRLYSDAVVELEIPILGAASSLNIPSVGNRADSAPTPELLASNGLLHGTMAAPSILAQAGYGAEQRRQVQEIIANVNGTTSWLQSDVPVAFDETRARLDTNLENVRAVTGDLRDRWSGWANSATSVIADVETNMGPMLTEARAGVGDARTAITNVNASIDENRVGLRNSVSNVESFTSKIDGPIYDQIEVVFAEAISALNDVGRAATRAASMLRDNRPDIERTVANMRLTSDQLKLTAIEVRQSPWRMLYQPGAKELENELLYDTVRQYSVAVSDLRQTALQLRAMQDDDGVPDQDSEERIADLLNRLTDAFSEYEEAEQRFLNEWVGSE